MIEHGEIVRDAHNRALVIFQERDNKMWQIAIKCTDRGEPYIWRVTAPHRVITGMQKSSHKRAFATRRGGKHPDAQQ